MLGFLFDLTCAAVSDPKGLTTAVIEGVEAEQRRKIREEIQSLCQHEWKRTEHNILICKKCHKVLR